MATVEGRVQTARAERYVAQLAEHLTQFGEHGKHAQQGQHGAAGAGAGDHDGPPKVRHVDRTDQHARIDLDWGWFVVTATPSELVLRVHADDSHALARGQELIEHRVRTIGRRDQLTVAWQAPQA